MCVCVLNNARGVVGNSSTWLYPANIMRNRAVQMVQTRQVGAASHARSARPRDAAVPAPRTVRYGGSLACCHTMLHAHRTPSVLAVDS
jgi:hypothetical protein